MSSFLDTNVLVYCTDARAPAKRERARTLVSRLSTQGEAVVSTQVLIELFHTLTRKQSLPPVAAQALVLACTAWPVIDSDLALVSAALEGSIARQLSIWDAMVVEAALRAEAHTLYSEDFSHGQRFGSLTVVNPFLS
ncbi:MAG: PIN domain-containing protein [Rubrivivax sp.]|nr:PIN domain-containing protein [Rubrivivax sp.]